MVVILMMVMMVIMVVMVFGVQALRKASINTFLADRKRKGFDNLFYKGQNKFLLTLSHP